MYTLYAMQYNIILYIMNLILYIYYRFIIHFPIGFDFLFTTYFLHFFLSWTSSCHGHLPVMDIFLSWTSSLSISNSAISASTLYNHVLVGLNHMPIPSHPTTFYDSYDILALEVCWSRGPDGIRCSNDLRRHQEFSQYSGSGYIFPMMY